MWWISIALGLFAAAVHWPIQERPVARLAAQPGVRTMATRSDSANAWRGGSAARRACAARCSPRSASLLAGALYLIAVRGEALLLDLATLRRIFCF